MDSAALGERSGWELANALNRCIQTCIDDERMFAASSTDVRNPDIKALFIALAKQRTDFIYALQGVVELLGAIPEDEGTIDGAADHSYALLVRRSAPPSDRSVLSHAERGVRRARHTYVAVLQDPALDGAPDSIITMLRRQYDAIRHTHDDLRRKLANTEV